VNALCASENGAFTAGFAFALRSTYGPPRDLTLGAIAHVRR